MLIDVKNLFKIYHEGEESEVRALDGVSLSVDRGEFLAIIGQSGSRSGARPHLGLPRGLLGRARRGRPVR